MAPVENAEQIAERRFDRNVLSLLGVGFAALLIAGLASMLVMIRSQDQVEWINHTYEVERQVSDLRLALEQMRSARRGLLLRMSLPEESAYEAAHARLEAGIERIRQLTADNPRHQRDVQLLDRQASELDRLFRGSMRVGASRASVDEAKRMAAAAALEMTALRMLDAERGLLRERDAAQRMSVTVFYAVVALVLALIAGIGIASVFIIRRYTRALSVSRNALRDLNENLEAAVQVRTLDLQRANDEIQRFAYIVSHDLRSPLVNVMGFTAELDASIKPLRAMIEKAEEVAPEIVSEDARLAVAEDLPESISFIRTSTQKMDRLINAILRLSREGRRTIAPEALYLDELARSVIDNLRHRIDENGITVTIQEQMPQIVTDRLALEQILSNLVENAVKYLQPGRPGEIGIGCETRHGRILLSVSDNGRGIEARDHDRVFDLFRRSGIQDQQGEGIGLAHVRALAYRLGGTIGLESELGRGSTFTVNLPIAYSEGRGDKS
ncbi:sensor histidine kinase [Sphingomonas sp. ID0503]|uniref:sensor histidine kinase n=1 Tax=Sphingomonas sp. ID0503 TaxID=3399691 RepID=UPI003AFB5A05